jgi:hypothetical protein
MDKFILLHNICSGGLYYVQFNSGCRDFTILSVLTWWTSIKYSDWRNTVYLCTSWPKMVLEMIRRGRLVWKSRSSAEAKSLKIRVKGTVWLPWQWDRSRGSQTARRGDSRPNKRATLTEYLLKNIELDNSSKPNWTRTKGSPPEKNTTSKKELLTLTLGNIAEGRSCSWWW